MNKEAFLKSNAVKVFLPVFLVMCIIVIARGGYETGQWLYDLLH